MLPLWKCSRPRVGLFRGHRRLHHLHHPSLKPRRGEGARRHSNIGSQCRGIQLKTIYTVFAPNIVTVYPKCNTRLVFGLYPSLLSQLPVETILTLLLTPTHRVGAVLRLLPEAHPRCGVRRSGSTLPLFVNEVLRRSSRGISIFNSGYVPKRSSAHQLFTGQETTPSFMH